MAITISFCITGFFASIKQRGEAKRHAAICTISSAGMSGRPITVRSKVRVLHGTPIKNTAVLPQGMCGKLLFFGRKNVMESRCQTLAAGRKSVNCKTTLVARIKENEVRYMFHFWTDFMGNQNVEPSYGGSGGIDIGGLLVYAWYALVGLFHIFAVLVWGILINNFYYSINGKYILKYDIFEVQFLIKQGQKVPAFGIWGFVLLTLVLIMCWIVTSIDDVQYLPKFVQVLICAIATFLPWLGFLAYSSHLLGPDAVSLFSSWSDVLETVGISFLCAVVFSFIPAKVFSLIHGS
jgi:hypothetical protein